MPAEVKLRSWPFPLWPGQPIAPQPVEFKAEVEPITPSPLVLRPRMRCGISTFNRSDQTGLADRPGNGAIGSVRRFWSHAPSDLKLISLILPVLLAVVLVSTLARGHKVPIRPVAQQTDSSPRPQEAALDSVKNVFSARLEQVRENLMSRAGVEFTDDFRSGLSNWQGEGDWAKSWSYDTAGSVRLGRLAFYQPSMRLSNYALDFVGQVDKRALGWVVRAADNENYYALKIQHIKPGPLPSAALVRYPVINGKEGKHVQVPLPFNVRTDTVYRVNMTVQGNDFTVSIQGQIVDAWSDTTLNKGGIGFFSARGEQGLLRWVEVSHQYDALGRLCAYLAPYHMQSGGSWKP